MAQCCWDVFSETFVFEILLEILTKYFVLKQAFGSFFAIYFWEVFGSNSLYSFQTGRVCCCQDYNIHLRGRWFAGSWTRCTRLVMTRKERVINRCCVIARDDVGMTHSFTSYEIVKTICLIFHPERKSSFKMRLALQQSWSHTTASLCSTSITATVKYYAKSLELHHGNRCSCLLKYINT